MQQFTIPALAFTGGFVIMSIELLGGRILSPYFGSSVYVWGSIITVFMLSLSAGYLLGGKMSLNKPSMRKFAFLFFFSGLLLYPLVYFGESIMELVFEHIEDPRYGSLTAALLMFLPPTVILGTISPYSVSLLVTEASKSGSVAGFLYFISTLGSAIGTLLTSFYLVLWFDINTILTGLTAALLVAAILTAALHWNDE